MGNIVFIDVREPQEFARGHVQGAINIPPSDLMAGAPQLKDIPKDSKLIVYCITGSRSNASINILKSLGYENVENGINQKHVEAKYFS
ncbi:rhodanese-like domain-containing protein [Candidatus Saccharibacteria bacterium]|nr:rhodanese-like domain-containing protein [Candidatus Saccharibacteria bacterium]